MHDTESTVTSRFVRVILAMSTVSKPVCTPPQSFEPRLEVFAMPLTDFQNFSLRNPSQNFFQLFMFHPFLKTPCKSSM